MYHMEPKISEGENVKWPCPFLLQGYMQACSLLYSLGVAPAELLIQNCFSRLPLFHVMSNFCFECLECIFEILEHVFPCSCIVSSHCRRVLHYLQVNPEPLSCLCVTRCTY